LIVVAKLLRYLRTLLLGVALVLAWLLVFGLIAWAGGALYYDFPLARSVAACAFLVAMLAALIFIRGMLFKWLALFGGFVVVLAWWLTQRPRNDRHWQPDVEQTAWAEISGDEVALHNVRNCEYRSETDYTPRWETRTVRLSRLKAVDLAITYWGSPYMAHPIASFEFTDDSPPVCFSIETRKQVGENYSAIGGFYRQYELIYIVSDERDVVRLRTNYRKGEDVYLYRTTIPPDKVRERFLEYVATVNELHGRPRWYNAATTHCTTSIRTQHAAQERAPWDWRMLVNGKGDELLFERRAIVTGGLPFADLKRQAHINPAAQAADSAPDFSKRIRAGRIGFEPPQFKEGSR
jgi:hypothetical protein